MSRGCLNDSLIAAGVISWKVTRLSLEAGTLMTSAMCQAIASPSRSRSVASQTCAAAFASLRSRRTCFSESSGTTYSGRKVTRSTPIFDLGRSRMWPNDASTLYSLPSIRSSVLAFVGDSTTTRSCLPSATFPLVLLQATLAARQQKGPFRAPTASTSKHTGDALYLIWSISPGTLPAFLWAFFEISPLEKLPAPLPPQAVDDVLHLLGPLL